MLAKDVRKRIGKFIAPYRVVRGKDFRLKDFDPRDTRGLASEQKEEAKQLLANGAKWLAEAQDRLYAQNSWSVLLVFQAMDAAGKDSTIKHVMSGVNPQGCQVFAFKQPSMEELDHDFLWRTSNRLPERGRIGIFNRSYYEEVLIVRVHEQLLEQQKIPPQLVTKAIWNERLEAITAFERHLAKSGTLILKFFLHVSKEEQKKRFMERLDRPEKNWKFSASDAKERGCWDQYMHAYEQAIRATAKKHAPWHVVPADNKWFTRLVVAAAIVEALDGLNLHYPRISAAQRAELAAARDILAREKD